MNTITKNISLKYKYIFAESIGNFNKELLSCIEQIKLIKKNNQLISHCFFIDCSSNEMYSQLKDEITNTLNEQNLSDTPFSVIAQKHDKYNIAIELAFVENNKNGTPIGGIQIINKKVSEIPYRIVQFEDYSLIIGMGLCGNVLENVKEQSAEAFVKAESILKAESCDFSNVVRQWNYIEDITLETKAGENHLQNYQVFNDVRSEFYNKNSFGEGYPAATGIGMQSGGIIIDFIALLKHHDVEIIPLKNPVQIDAHKYSEQVLIGNENYNHKTTPKFERGKIIETHNKTNVYVSGTAAIEGEKTIASSSIEKQTYKTLSIIDHLISSENLKNNGVQANTELKCEIIRVYVRRNYPLETADKIVKEKYPNTPVLTVIGNVCRNDLLVEIEGVFCSTQA